MSDDRHLRSLLLDLAAPARHADPATLARLSDDDWSAMLAMARAHRIDPLLHARFRAGAGGVPQSFVAACAAMYRQRSLRALLTRRALLLVARELSAAGIDFVAMKGAYLAFHAYPEAGMRPLRDLDILVARQDALPAHRALLARGYVPASEGGDPAQQLAIKHQLPTLLSPDTGTAVEVHHRAFHGHAGDPDLIDDPGFADRLVTREIAGETLRYMGCEDLLLHLIVHSVYDHRFDNGPGILADIAALLATHDMDWPLFWEVAQRQGRDRGALFALALTDRRWAPLSIDWQGRDALARAIPDALLADAAQLSLRDLQTSADLALLSNARGSGGARLLGKLFPDPALLRAAYPNGGKARELPGLYVRKWRDIALTRVPAVARSVANKGANADLDAMDRMARWLTDEEGRYGGRTRART